MISMKKVFALLGVSVLLCSTTVAAASPTAQDILSAEGFVNASDSQAAAERGMSAGEYYNNVVSSAPGVTNAMVIGQGGKILINGVATNLTATLGRVNKSVAGEAQAQAAALGGSLLNVVNVSFPGAKYKEATINFYVKGLEAGKKVAAKQYVNGTWIDVTVVEARADHVVLNLTNAGPVAFVALP